MSTEVLAAGAVAFFNKPGTREFIIYRHGFRQGVFMKEEILALAEVVKDWKESVEVGDEVQLKGFVGKPLGKVIGMTRVGHVVVEEIVHHTYAPEQLSLVRKG